jgi:hypothetical protein
MHTRPSLRGFAVAAATVVATSSAALGVSAFTEGSTEPAATASVVVPTRAEVSRELTTEKQHARAVEQAKVVAARRAAAKAAAEKAAAEQAAKERAVAEREAEQARASRSTQRTGDPRSIAESMLSEHGWSASQFSCLESLWQKESNWQVDADNPSSSAYGIPQALPGSKMSSAGSDWETNPATQIEWGLGYIADTYGSPCSAWSHSESNGWY